MTRVLHQVGAELRRTHSKHEALPLDAIVRALAPVYVPREAWEYL